LSNGKNRILIDLPTNFWWHPYEVVIKGTKDDLKRLLVSEELGEYLIITAPDGWRLEVTIKYKGWLWNREKTINIFIPIRLKPVTNLKYKIV
jgi:hypothetical protein